MPSSLFYFDRLKGKKNQSTQELEFWMKRVHDIEALSLPLKCPLNETNNDSANSTLHQIHKQTWPILFLGVKGEDKSVALESFTTDSWQNAIEAQMVLEIVTTLVKGGVVMSRIGVMAPFREYSHLSDVSVVRQSKLIPHILFPIPDRRPGCPHSSISSKAELF